MTRGLVVATYTALGVVLVATRTIGLDRSYWHDEIVTVADYVVAGPREILAGAYLPNNHQLYSMLGWGTSSLVGESEVLLRLLAVVPFLAGVVLVAAWLHVRVSFLSGALFCFLATVAPLLVDISRQARGYGIGFLAMAVLVVTALEAQRTGRIGYAIGFAVAGAVGTMTLPNFGIPFLAIGAVLLTDRRLRPPFLAGLAASSVAIAAWYTPHLDDIWRGSRQGYGPTIELPWVVTAPVDQILIPSLVWIDGVALVAGLVWLPVVAVAVLLAAQSRLLESRRTAATLLAGPVATVLALALSQTSQSPRFSSFLTVPVFMLLASGMAQTFERLRDPHPPLVRALVAGVVVGLLCVGFVRTSVDVVRLPREAHKDAAAAIRRDAPAAQVYAAVYHPRDLGFYLRQPFLPRRFVTAERVCDANEEVVLVVQAGAVVDATIPCLEREGVRRLRFEQYARGDEIVVWVIPPARA